MAALQRDFSKIPSSVDGWAATPAPFSTSKHGTRVKFSEDNSVAERVRSAYYMLDLEGNAVVYTAHRLPVEQVWQTTILSTVTRSYNGGMVSGLELYIFTLASYQH